jgi:DNA-binding protein HU-beta
MAKTKTGPSKAELVRDLQSHCEHRGLAVTQAEISGVLESLVEAISSNLKRGNTVTVPGLAKFMLVDTAGRPAREGVNPRTGERVSLPATKSRRVVKARVLPSLKERHG